MNTQNIITLINDYLTHMAKHYEQDLLNACKNIDRDRAITSMADLLGIMPIKNAAEALSKELPRETDIATYMLSTLTIQEACTVLTKTEDEDFCFATGFAAAPKTYSITRLLQFKLKRKSVIAAEGDPEAVTRLLIGLYHHGHKLLMTLHSHPGCGPNSTHPSSTDINFHRRLEAGDYPTIGMIVNREGYVRFFSDKRKFKIVIHGKGIEVINENSNIFKLDNIGSI